FYHCKLLGNQDTYYTKGYGRIFMKDCYIEGTTDFIFGRAVVVFDSCQIHSKKVSYITAASTEQEYSFGYVFFDCLLTAKGNIGNVALGRPWRPYARTVFIHSYLDKHIAASGWSEWDGNNNHTTCFYAEYDCFGPKADRTYRKAWSHELTPQEAADYTIPNIFAQTTAPLQYNDDWLPVLDSLPYEPYVEFPAQTSIEELKEEFQLNAFPNPGTDLVIFQFMLTESEQVSLTLLDMGGKLIKEIPQQHMNAGAQKIAVTVSELPEGQYFYRLQIGENILPGAVTVLKP
ncbi:MAG: T9SS type A sorting domain-containing protein, partial [Bacteroidetes bacterium]|nr:T9SS type A sorting domain-containing protein [Bacteroidota bacterium]